MFCFATITLTTPLPYFPFYSLHHYNRSNITTAHTHTHTHKHTHTHTHTHVFLFSQHNIRSDGMAINTDAQPDNSWGTFFQDTGANKFVPRSVFVDLEPTVMDEIRVGNYSKLFHPDNMLSSKEDAAGNFARGYYTIGKEAIDTVMDRLRRISENCSAPQGFMITHSFGGGTGSGLTAAVMERLSADYPKQAKMQFCVYPSPNMATSITEPYNAVLLTHRLHEHSDMSFILDNEAMYDLCKVWERRRGRGKTKKNKVVLIWGRGDSEG
jgi:hypothetical protein